MKVLLLKDYFYPENCAGINLTIDMLEAIAKSGNSAVVFTPIPCRGIEDPIRKKYRRKKKESLFGGRVIIHRYWLPYEGKSIVGRAFRYILQNIIQIIKALSCDYDIAILGSTPPTMGLVGTVLKKLRHKKYIFNIQDVFPDSLITTGLAKQDGIAWKIGTIMSNISYRNATALVTISNSMKKTICSKGVLPEKVVVIPNWVDTSSIVPIARENNLLFDELNLSRERFYVVYAGNIGKAQGTKVIIEAAEKLKDVSDITFLIFGAGAEYDSIKINIEDRQLKNVRVFGLRPINEVSYVYSMGNISLITSKKGTGLTGLPSKTWSILATATMPIACFDVDSDLAKLIQENEIGLVVQPEDGEALKKAILDSYSNQRKCEAMGQKGRKLVKDFFSKEHCTQKYIELLSDYR